MATDLDTELLEAFEAVGSSVSPPPDLAARARQRVRVRRQRSSSVIAVAVLIVGGLGLAVVDHGPLRLPHHVRKVHQPRFRVSAVNVNSMAVGGGTLYVAVSAYPEGLLTAYDRTTGVPLRSAKLPAEPNSVAVGADGTVWVTFFPENAGRREGVSEFSADLSRRSTLLTNDHYLETATFDVVPLGHGRALLATHQGLVTAALPRLSGARTVHANRSNARLTALPGQDFGPPTDLTALSDGNVAVLLSSGGGQSRLILHDGDAEFAGTEMTLAASPEGLWVTTGTGRRSVLQRLSNSLAPLPIGAAVHTVTFPSGADRVWTSGQTVWVGTDDHRIRLTCFAFSSPSHEPSATVTLPAADSAEAIDPVVSGDLTIVVTQQDLYVASPYGITSYPVPASCRT